MESRAEKIILYLLVALAVFTAIYIAFDEFNESQIVQLDGLYDEMNCQFLEVGFIPSDYVVEE